MTNYFTCKDKQLCCGCRGCEQICPQKCISMEMDTEGFIYPIIDKTKCIGCKLCENVCPIKDGGYENKDVLDNIQVYGGYNKDEDILEKSTSGGIFSSIVESVFNKKTIVFGAEFDEKLNVRHSYIKEKINLDKFRGSKYVQSDLKDSYTNIKKFLNDDNKVIFSGTPCQVAGLKSFLKVDYDNLICIDIVCHGVPSPKVFKMYKEYLEKKYKSDIKSINFRDKSIKGWDTPYMTIDFNSGKKITNIGYDDYFSMGFYKKLYQRPVCHKCPFTKTKRVSDVTIADFWGVEDINNKIKNNKGTSLVIFNSKKSLNILEKIKDTTLLERVDLKEAIKFNPQLVSCTNPNEQRNEFMMDLNNGYDFNMLRKKYLKKRALMKRIASKMINKSTKQQIKKFLNVKRK
ncbi:MAG: Coenzyme F420 hydrogenase/dehydrogenase, beta subunit C-terminal domain [Paraclostridium sp.]